MRRHRLLRPGDHRNPGRHGGHHVGAERVDGERVAVARAQHGKRAVRLAVGQQAELQAHRLGLHELGHALELRRRRLPAEPSHALRARDPAADAAVEEGEQTGDREDADDARPAQRVHALARRLDAHHLLDRGAHRRPLGAGPLRRLRPGLGQRRVVTVGGGEVAERPVHLQDLLGGFLDLAEALEIPDRTVIVFDADAEQRQRRDFQELGEPLDGVELDDVAFFIAIEGRARDAEPGCDFLGPHAGFEAERTQLLSDIGEAHGASVPIASGRDARRRPGGAGASHPPNHGYLIATGPVNSTLT
jgi:hypothetical protein